MLVAAEVAPTTAVQIWTLVVAAFAALAALSGAILAAISASHRDRAAWLRQEQTLAYEAFSSAAWTGLDELSSGAVERALQHPQFTGLDESVLAVQSHTAKMFDAYRRIAVVGGTQVVEEVGDYVAEWTIRCGIAVPLSGVAHTVALEQWLFYVKHFSSRLLLVATTMRDDLGLLSKDGRTNLLRDRETRIPPPPLNFHGANVGDANFTLRRWKVRTWGPNPTVGPNYQTPHTPWVAMKLPHNVLRRPLIAAMRKAPGAAWIFAMDSSLTPSQVDLIERDAATVVTTNGRGGDTKFGGGQWVAGEVPGERIYWWDQADGPLDR
jgi:hypothetical protein